MAILETKDWVHLAFDSATSQNSNATGEKPPIILLHGVTNAKETWNRVLRPIAELTGRKVYAYDARNHGESGWSDNLSYDIMKEDLYKFVDSLHAERVVLIGHSMGGKTAMFFALKWPEKVEKLIVEDMTPKSVGPGLRDMALKYVHLLKHTVEQIPEDIKDLSEAKKFVSKYIRDAIAKAQTGNSSEDETDSSILPLTVDKNGKYRWLTNLDAIENSFLTRTQSLVKGTYKGPALFLWGTKSPYKVRDDRDYILQYFPDARFRAIEGAAHQIHLLYEDVFLDEVAHFINDAR